MKVNKVLSKTIFLAVSATSMFFSTSELFAQVKIGSNPATITANRNLEVESSNGSKFGINQTTGKVLITDGSEGAGKVFTSNVNGVGTWQDKKTLISLGAAGDPPTLIGGQTDASTDFKYSNINITLSPGKWLIFLNATYKNELDRACNAYWDLSTSKTTNTTTSRVVGASGPYNNYLPVSAIYNVDIASTTTYYFFVGVPGSTSGQAVYSGEKRIFAMPIE